MLLLYALPIADYEKRFDTIIIITVIYFNNNNNNNFFKLTPIQTDIVNDVDFWTLYSLCIIITIYECTMFILSINIYTG